jgi:hypothetical protein
MTKKSAREWFAAFVLAPTLVFAVGDHSTHRTSEQTHFAAEQETDPIQKPVTLPSPALRALSKDQQIADCLEGSGLPPGQLPASWVVGSLVHLGAPSETDFVVQPRSMPPTADDEASPNSCLYGANVEPFWIISKTTSGYRLVLATIGIGLEVLTKKTRGHRNIRMTAGFGGSVHQITYVWNGSRYEVDPKLSRSEEIK